MNHSAEIRSDNYFGHTLLFTEYQPQIIRGKNRSIHGANKKRKKFINFVTQSKKEI
jgi:hypothetical protein